MAFNPQTIRRAFLGVAILVLMAVIGFYSYARYRVNRSIKDLPAKLGVEVKQRAKGFTFTKSEKGRKQFSISADTAIQYKDGVRATLNDVRIIVYGRGVKADGQLEDRYDQIFGKQFEYDQKSGEVKANGVVDIDLEHHGAPTDDPMHEHAEPGSIHARTSGLVFNKNTGIAQTKEALDFSLPQASGSAVGAIYESDQRRLTLVSQVRITTSTDASPNKQVNLSAATINAAKAVITDEPRRVELMDVQMKQQDRELHAPEVSVFLRPDSNVDHVHAGGGVTATDRNPRNPASMHAREANFTFAGRNALKAAIFEGDVRVDSSGPSPMNGSATKAEVTFAAANQVSGIRALGGVNFSQSGGKQSAQSTNLQAPEIDFVVKSNEIVSASTVGSSQITLEQAQSKTLVTADRFEAGFTAQRRISSLRGAPNARVVFATDKTAEQRVTTSDEVVARFENKGSRNGQIQSVEQSGNFRYVEGKRTASADHARYTPADDAIVATGAPRFEDAASGLALTADALRFNRKTNSVAAEGNVKTTYASAKAGSSGALLGGPEPVHVTSQSASATTAGKARFSGSARLWQQASIIEAATIDFDRGARTLVATGGPKGRVMVNFTQADASGKQVPVIATSDRLNYTDAQRKATFSGGVEVTSAEVTMRAKQMDVVLKPRDQRNQAGGQLDQIIATGTVQLEQKNPVRKGSGAKLVYTADHSKFILTSGPGETASIFDAERGDIQADSLTFFSRDDTVQVGSGQNSRVVTKTRIKEDSRP